jgi:hypothetical protein
MELWWPIETDQFKNYSSMTPDPRESYLRLEGTWGTIQAGRSLGLHDRGVGYAARAELGGFKIGAGGNFDIGGGAFTALSGPVPLDSALELRHTDGYFGHAMYSLGPVDPVTLDVNDANDHEIDSYAKLSVDGIPPSSNLGQFVQLAVVSVKPH